jgi:hypothetical protein
MITIKEIISGTEEELLEYFKEKYNLVEYSMSPLSSLSTSMLPNNDLKAELPTCTVVEPKIKPAVVGNKVTTGFGGLFDGTSWGNK